MVNHAECIPHNPDRELLTHYLEGLAPYADSGDVYSHNPDSGTYWKAVDLVQVALHLSGLRVWVTDSYTGGASVAADRSRAERYIGYREPLAINTLRCVQPFAEVSFMSGRLLVGLDERIEAHTKAATHPSSEGFGEFTATSMRLSDMDPVSRNVLVEVFQLPPGYDTEFVYNGLASNADDIIDEWQQDNEAASQLLKSQLPAPATTPQWTGLKLTIPS